MITVTINGRQIQLDRPTTVLEAAGKLGIHIPTLCNHQALEPYGGCRLCLVEVEKMPKLQPACMLQTADGMVVKTESEAVVRARRGILELLLINHPLDCPHCDKAGECELQDAVSRHGSPVGRFTEGKRKRPESYDDPIIFRNMERCILCLRCVRMCAGVQGASAISVVDRGGHSTIEPFSGARFNCEYCGNCITVCPVGALLSRLPFHNYRPWAIDRNVPTVCGFCGVGCSFVVQARDNVITRVAPQFGLGLNDGLLCTRGRFGYEFRASEERLREPLLRKNGKLEKVTWDEALEFVSRRLAEIRDQKGGNAIGGIASPRCTNEDNYVFQKFLREVCRTDHIDSASRLGFAAAQKYIEAVLGEGVTASAIADLRSSDAILVVGGDPTTVNPILGLAIRGGARKGARLAVVGEAKGLDRFKTLSVTPPVFREPDVLEALLVQVFRTKGGRGEKKPLYGRIGDLAEAQPPAGLPQQEIDRLSELLSSASSPAVVTGMDVVQRQDGHRSLFAIAALTDLLGAKLYLLSEKPNEQGLVDMGCRPETGLTLLEMLEAIRAKHLSALYVMGENPAFSLPDSKAARQALSSLDLLIVQDIFLTETAELAHVVLPALAWSEKEGTYTNLERRIQRLRKAVHSSFGMEDWRIIAQVAGKMGHALRYGSAEDILREIAHVSPLYKGVTTGEIEKGDCLWPYHAQPSSSPNGHLPPVAAKRAEFAGNVYLAVEKPLYHSGTLSRQSEALNQICPEPTLKMSPRNAERFGLKQADRARVTTERGSLSVPVVVDDAIQDHRVFLSNNFEARGVYELLGFHMDEVTKAPGLEGFAVKIEKSAE